MSRAAAERPLRLNAERFNPLIGLLLLLFAIYVGVAVWAYRSGNRSAWQVPCVWLIPLAFYSVAFAGWRVEITADEITVVTFFWWKRSVRRSDITGWAMKTGWRRGDRIGRVPYRRLEIYTGPGSKPFMIFTKPLKLGDLHKLIGQLPPKAAA